MRDGLGCLRLCQPIIHRPVEVRRKLRCLPVRDQGADGDEAAVPRGEVRAQPQITEQHVGRVLHDSRKGRAELLLDELCALGFGGLVYRQQGHGSRGKVVRADVTRRKGIPGDGDR